MDPEKIRAEAKTIIDEFVKALEGIPELESFGVMRDKTMREVSESKYEGEKFKISFLANAPDADQNFIFASKKKW